MWRADPSSEVEDSVFSSFLTVVQVELPSMYAEKTDLEIRRLEHTLSPGGGA